MKATRCVGLSLAFAVVAGTSGCAKLLEYPEPVLEQGMDLCHNGLDDDFDGRMDCEDPDCLGSCSEETPAECSDGKDNDGDGLVDAADPRCWLSAPPTAERCAKAYGVEVVNRFDTLPDLQGINQTQGSYTSEWAFWGFDGERPVITHAPHRGPERRDLLLDFAGNTTGSSTLGQNLGSYVRQLPFSGSFRGFQLSFSAAVPPGAILRAGLVPVGLAPSTVAPIAGAETALLSVAIDRYHSPPTLEIAVEGLRRSSELAGDVQCDAASTDCLGELTLTFDDAGFLATYVDESGASTEVRSTPPSTDSVPPARLVLWGGSAAGSSGARLDDLRLEVAPELPCGIDVPQIPGTDCAADWFQGYTVSVARAKEGTYCALAAASDWDASASHLTLPLRADVWSSADGDHWASQPPLVLPLVPVPLVGAAIAADESGFHAALILRDDASNAVELGFTDADSCDHFDPVVLGPELPPDVEAPSYVIAGGRHDVLYTRPPAAEVGRTLWRVPRNPSGAKPELLAALPAGVEAPVNLQLVGSRDLVLSAPSRAGGGGGIVLFVADPDLRAFRAVGSGPILSTPPSPDLPGSAGKLGFDDREVLSAALFAGGEGGFFLYGGRSTEGDFSSDFGTPLIAVGTARLRMQGEAPSDTPEVPPPTCGDGVCDSGEDCVRCESDCPCPGRTLLSDVFSDAGSWVTASSDPNPAALLYIGENPRAMNFGGGAPTWSALALEHPVAGDFELAFDALVEFGDVDGGLAYVGLGTALHDASEPMGVAPDSGVFARIAQCSWTSSVMPFASVDATPYLSATAEFCWADTSQVQGAWQHVVLRREGNQVSVSTPMGSWEILAQSRTTCGSESTSLNYVGPLEPLTHLLIGFGGGVFDDSAQNAHSGSITNVELRSLDDPDACPEGKARCERPNDAPTCVDTSSSAEDCGSCGHRCAAFETCDHGSCLCESSAEVTTVLECDGICVDTASSVANCGACGNTCRERCLGGICDPATGGDCSSPFTIPPEGGSTTISFPGSGQHVPADVCNGRTALAGPSYVDARIGAWTPALSGTAVVEVVPPTLELPDTVAVDTVVGVTEDPTCNDWLACNDDVNPGRDLGSRVSVPVIAGHTYRVAVAAWDYLPPEGSSAELRIEVLP
jgi:hypothetical protein